MKLWYSPNRRLGGSQSQPGFLGQEGRVREFRKS